MKEFMKLVWQMRLAQKYYYKTRNYQDLRKAKAFEERVDDEIKREQDRLLQTCVNIIHFDIDEKENEAADELRVREEKNSSLL